MLQKMHRKENIMIFEVNLSDGEVMEIRIEKGQITEVTRLYTTGGMKRHKREEVCSIKGCLKNVFTDNVDDLRYILKKIEYDEYFFSYVKSLFDAAKELKTQELMDAINFVKSSIAMLAEKQKEVDKYTL